MPYETATASGPNDLLSKLATFAGNNGWTVNFSGPRTGGIGGAGHATLVSRDGVFLSFRSENTAGISADPGSYVWSSYASGYSAASTETQPDNSPPTRTNWMDGPFIAYHFFGSPVGVPDPYLYAVVEVQSGIFRHFGGGRLRRMGNYVDGSFCYATAQHFDASRISQTDWGGHCWPFQASGRRSNSGGVSATVSSPVVARADCDGISPLHGWGGANGNVTPPTPASRLIGGGGQFTSSSEGLMIRSIGGTLVGPSGYTGRTYLTPFYINLTRAPNFSPLGYPPDLRSVRIDTLNPGDILTLGGDEWMVFPVVRKNGVAGTQNSGDMGMAYRRTV